MHRKLRHFGRHFGIIYPGCIHLHEAKCSYRSFSIHSHPSRGGLIITSRRLADAGLICISDSFCFCPSDVLSGLVISRRSAINSAQVIFWIDSLADEVTDGNGGCVRPQTQTTERSLQTFASSSCPTSNGRPRRINACRRRTP